jgi:hypothetical protein
MSRDELDMGGGFQGLNVELCRGVRAEYFENGVKGLGTLVNEPGMTGGVAEGAQNCSFSLLWQCSHYFVYLMALCGVVCFADCWFEKEW